MFVPTDMPFLVYTSEIYKITLSIKILLFGALLDKISTRKVENLNSCNPSFSRKIDSMQGNKALFLKLKYNNLYPMYVVKKTVHEN